MKEEDYKNLFDASRKIEKLLELKKKEGILNNFHVEIIPDDFRIEIIAFYKKAVKTIKTTIRISRKGKDEDTK